MSGHLKKPAKGASWPSCQCLIESLSCARLSFNRLPGELMYKSDYRPPCVIAQVVHDTMPCNEGDALSITDIVLSLLF